PLNRSEDHRGRGIRVKNGQLLLQLRRYPHIVGIQEGYIRTLSVMDAQIPRCTHAEITMMGVLEIADLFGILGSDATSDFTAAVLGTIIYKEDFPVLICLC